jgi:signal transduction histidine kinase
VRLADFIETNSKAILEEWVTFASTSGPAGETMDLAGLRDHAVEMLRIIVKDLRTPQSKAEQTAKSKGDSDSTPATADTPAEVHGAGRAASGFTLGEMVSEYRALRASVIRLWTKQCGTLKGEDLEDLMRFNEAIDQSTAESITRYMQDLDQSKELFLAILGHDLRTPLGAVIMSSQFMLDTGDLREPHLELTGRILRSARRMNRMVGDLLDFTRSRLGSGIPIVRQEMEMGNVVQQAVEEMRAADPGSDIKCTTTGDLKGQWDSARISQLLTNLLSNAVQHGTPKARITVTACGDKDHVEVKVQNGGTPIPGSDLPRLFDPMKLPTTGAGPTSKHLGLGLYIAERIVTAHGGTIEEASSQEAGTTFTVLLPR